MEIRYFPDPVLQRRAVEAEPGQPELRDLVDGMKEAMREAQGVGLAAPQVGHGLRLFIASDTGEADDVLVCLNPRIEPFGPVVEMEEGCLSVPGIRALISRTNLNRGIVGFSSAQVRGIYIKFNIGHT